MATQVLLLLLLLFGFVRLVLPSLGCFGPRPPNFGSLVLIARVVREYQGQISSLPPRRPSEQQCIGRRQDPLWGKIYVLSISTIYCRGCPWWFKPRGRSRPPGPRFNRAPNENSVGSTVFGIYKCTVSCTPPPHTGAKTPFQGDIDLTCRGAGSNLTASFSWLWLAVKHLKPLSRSGFFFLFGKKRRHLQPLSGVVLYRVRVARLHRLFRTWNQPHVYFGRQQTSRPHVCPPPTRPRCVALAFRVPFRVPFQL